MADFSNLAITHKGRMLLADVQAGGVFDATRLVMGSGAVPVGKTPATMTDVVAPVISIDINSKDKTPDGKVIFGGYYSNKDVTEEFYFKEFALYARAIYLDADGEIISTGDEVLYSYGNAGNTADLIPAYTTGTVVEKQLEMVSYVGSETEVNLTIESDIYTSKREFNSHAARHAAGGADAITPESIGAAPGGFGLGGGGITTLTPETIDFATQGGWYLYDGVGTKLNNINFNYATVRVDTHNDIHSEQFLSPAGSGLWLKRTLKSGVWGAWESVNPPMHNGVEYRTTERIDGKAVYKKNANGVIQYRLEGETEWKNYAQAVGAVDKSGDTVNGNLNVNGALMVERSDNNRKARTVIHNNADKEADFQNYTDDSNYVGIRVATEEKGVGDAAKVVQMKNGQFASFPILHTGNKEKIFTFGAEDLVAGTSPLGTGQLHFVYE